MALQFIVRQRAGLPGRKTTSLCGVAFVLTLTVGPEVLEPNDAAVMSKFLPVNCDSPVPWR